MITTFSCGDIAVHPKKPEWGKGVVKQASVTVYKGKSGQRLTVDFVNHKRVVINTAVVPLRAGGEDVASGSGRTSGNEKNKDQNMLAAKSNDGWLDSLEKSASGKEHELWSLPDDLTDPFASLSEKLEATLAAYRYSTEARSLIEWAILQTGLDDPMTRYTRSELEQEFPRFARDRELHLKQLVKQMKREGQQLNLRQIRNKVTNLSAQMALDKAMR